MIILILLRILAADLLYHPNCLRKYIQKHQRSKEHETTVDSQVLYTGGKREFFQKYVPFLREALDGGKGIALTEIRDIINDEGAITIQTHEVKNYISETFGESIQFCKSERKNESLLVFSSSISMADVINTVRATDVIKEAAVEMRNALLNMDFNLDNKFCDAHELQDSWRNTVVPDTLMTFLSALFNMKKISLLKQYHDEDEDEEKTESNVTAKLMSLIQIMYYKINHGKKKTPLHVMNSHAIYDTCKSRTLITSFNRLGLCESYNSVKRQRRDLAKYAIIKNNTESIICLPSHVSATSFTLAAFDNFDHLDRNSLSGGSGAHDTAISNRQPYHCHPSKI